jgi:hypothetical protein
VEPLHSSKDDLLDRTREVWAPRLGGDLTREDARQIAANIVGFFEILNQWRLKQEIFRAISNGNARRREVTPTA